MSIARYFSFDLFENRIKVQNHKHLFKYIVDRIAPDSDVNEESLLGAFHKHYEEKGISCNDGVGIFDMSSTLVDKPMMFVTTMDNPIDLNAQDNKPVDVLVGVVSPKGPSHLQRLSGVTRMFRSKSLLKALREASNQDEMQVLFMPSQDWIKAA